MNRTKNSQPRFAGAFSLVEILVVSAIVAILAALAVPAISGALTRADRTKFVSNLRSVGMAMNLYAADHQSRFVGPLWPGQVVEYDRDRAGRLVRELAPYLEIADRSPAYVVDRFLPGAFRKALPNVAPKDIRVWVMNMAVPTGSGATANPWGSLVAGQESDSLRRSALPAAAENVWMMSEAYQTHPRVAGAAWRMNTVPRPPFGPLPLGLFFDGRVETFDPSTE
ncbi:MAG: prepilin-type N-terminal cleavage/methylation domain-containing protein [Terrimicrobiaceae bacterium]|nr:prepilin-type N-terminal cleavage/methylation domain-containing protein [Terrimicrobiaceae bacterium]